MTEVRPAVARCIPFEVYAAGPPILPAQAEAAPPLHHQPISPSAAAASMRPPDASLVFPDAASWAKNESARAEVAATGGRESQATRKNLTQQQIRPNCIR